MPLYAQVNTITNYFRNYRPRSVLSTPIVERLTSASTIEGLPIFTLEETELTAIYSTLLILGIEEV